MGLGFKKTADWLARHRRLIGKFVFELVIVFIGVTAAFAMEDVRQRHEDRKYTSEMVAALRPSFENVGSHAREIDQAITLKLRTFDDAVARGERPAPPVYREEGGERPPTRNWDAVVATGVAKSLEPKLFFRLAHFFNLLDSFGERYIRYNDFTESRVLAAGDDASVFYDPATGVLKPEFRAHIDRLRDLKQVNLDLIDRAARLDEALSQVK